MKTKLLFSLLLFVGSLHSANIQRLGLEQGLSSNYVYGITQDKQGLIWIATPAGLNRFDGQEFKTFFQNNGNSISCNDLHAVYADPVENKIWIATSRQGLSVYDCNKNHFENYNHSEKDKNSIISNSTSYITSSSDGNLWIATTNGGVDLFNKSSRKFTHYNTSTVKGMPSNEVWSVSDDQQGNLYIAHNKDGISILSIKSKRIKNFKHDPNNPGSLPLNRVSCIFIDSNKNIWVGTEKGLALFNPITQKFLTFYHNPKDNNSISSDFISSLNETNDKKLIIGTVLDGINILDLKQLYINSQTGNIHFDRIEAGYNSNQLSSRFALTTFCDCYGNLWVGTSGGGINFIPNRKPFFYTYEYNPIVGNTNNLSTSIVHGVCIDKKNSVWIATDGGGIDVFNQNKKIGSYNEENGKLPENFLFTAFSDSEGNQWFGTYDGQIYMHKFGTAIFNKLSCFDVKKSHINCFYEDNNKNVWIGTNEGLHSYNLTNKKVLSLHKSREGLTDNMVMTVVQDSQGKIWIGTVKGTICILDKTFKRIRDFSPNNNQSIINYLYRDSYNRIWAATGQGLLLFKDWKDNTYKVFDKEHGLNNNYVSSLIEDDNNQLWLGTNNGISSLNLKHLKIKNFNKYDGVPLSSFRAGAVAKSSDGIIYFGSDNGVCYFDPRAEQTELNIPPAVITSFNVSRVEESYTGKLEYIPTLSDIDLKYNQNTFTIYFNVLDYSYNNQVEFSYMLEGLENAWYNINIKKEVTFRNLPPGDYTFHVKSRYKNQEWAANPAELHIHINPPFWLSWWAESIYSILILCIILFIIRFFKKRLDLENSYYLEKQNNIQQKKLNEERLGFYTNITHELRTPLTLIVGPLEDMINDIKLTEFYRSRLSLINKSAIRLLELINQILEFRKTETQNRKLCVRKGDLSNHVKEITLKYEELNRNNNVKITCKTDGGDFNTFFDNEVITIILDNLISNAIKYTKKGEIIVSLNQLNQNNIDYIELRVSDTGYGITQDALPYIFNNYYQAHSKHQASGTGIGLSIVKNLTQLHEATIVVESEVDKGTSFIIRFLANNIYLDALHPDDADIVVKEDTNPDNKQVLLVIEDNEDIRNYIAWSFVSDFEVLTAENGAIGLELAISRTPDIIISDIMMPVMDGIEMCRQIKEDIRTCHIPVVMLTAKDSILDKTEGYDVGADSYITKPFSGNLLRSRVYNLIEARKRIAAQYRTALIVSEEEQQTKTINPIDNEFMIKITRFVEEHIEDEEINIASIADIVFMSHSTLYRKIKALTGLSASEFIRKIRIQKAKELLLTGKYNISEVMYMVGISSPTYFRKCFKEEFNISPMECQKRAKQEQ
ncbi:MAG: two-component regulator propeller domain-containing protein [Paludibacter sp.]|nr:two-component regulator propeller domain-containing protein [Paludibacter sp.]